MDFMGTHTRVIEVVHKIALKAVPPCDLKQIIYDEVRALVEAEVERCAKVCEEVSQNWSANNDEYKDVAILCAKSVRAGRSI
jgi:hypothetical protein